MDAQPGSQSSHAAHALRCLGQKSKLYRACWAVLLRQKAKSMPTDRETYVESLGSGFAVF